MALKREEVEQNKELALTKEETVTLRSLMDLLKSTLFMNRLGARVIRDRQSQCMDISTPVGRMDIATRIAFAIRVASGRDPDPLRTAMEVVDALVIIEEVDALIIIKENKTKVGTRCLNEEKREEGIQ